MRQELIDTHKEFIQAYLNLVGPTEAPLIFHRWSVYSCIAALLGRQAKLPFGHWIFYPNMYIMFMGSPGTRKSTAINIGKAMIERAGYSEDKFAADRSSKERFLIDLIGGEPEDEEDLFDLEIDGMTSEKFIVADEFTDFTGKSNIDFLTCLGKLWDCPPSYKQPKIHGKSVVVPQPTVNILSGNTPQAFYLSMPIEASGQGYMSRNIFVHAEPTGKKIPIPPTPDPVHMREMTRRMEKIAQTVKGVFTYGKDSMPILERLYREYVEIEDYRFKHYNTRRFTHLLKLTMVFAASRYSLSLEPEDFIFANTLLHFTEVKMPLALGEFGKARNADIANAVIEIIKSAKKAVTMRYIWKQVAQDLNRQEELIEIIRNLSSSGKIQQVQVGDVIGYQTKHERQQGWKEDLLYPNFLTEEEK